MRKGSTVTVTDQFCGAGGSSQGVRLAAADMKLNNGLEVKLAMNHWKLAIETHNTNFPDTDHVCTDISACDPRRYHSTNILITSPECTVHSPAGGGQAKKRKFGSQMDISGKLSSEIAEERSRATMWDVCRFAEYHTYEIIIVENVIEARKWVLFDSWLNAMLNLGYEHELKFINSMHAHPTPQSRDRMYCIFWKKKNKKPDLNFTPEAPCMKCAKIIEAYQWWKPSKRKENYGKYRTQYLFKCPECHEVVEPYFYAAFNCIDWSRPGTRIGDRKKKLSSKTEERCQYGIDKYWDQPTYINVKYSSGVDFRVKPVAEEPLATQPQDQAMGILNPMIISGRYIQGIANRVKSSLSPLPVQVTDGRESVLLPPVIVSRRDHGNKSSRNSQDPLPTQTCDVHDGVLNAPIMISVKYDGVKRRVKSTEEPMPSQTSQEERGLLFPPIIMDAGWDKSKRVIRADEEALGTQDTGQTKGVMMPFIIKNFSGPPQKPVLSGDPLGSITTSDHHAIVTPLIDEQNSSGKARPASEPLATVLSQGNHHGLLNMPLIDQQNGESKPQPATEPIGSITTKPKAGIITANAFNSFISYYNGRPQASHITEPVGTISTVERLHMINEPHQKPRLEDCYYRMLLPAEIQIGMAFDEDYIVLGDSRQKVKQLGNAVTPPVMRFLIKRCVASLL